MDNVYAEALKQYGLVGFIVVAVLLFVGWILLKSFLHWIESSKLFAEALEGNTNSMQDMGHCFTAALEKNSDRVIVVLEKNIEAMHQMAQANLILANANENMMRTADRNTEQNHQEHARILDFMQRVTTK